MRRRHFRQAPPGSPVTTMRPHRNRQGMAHLTFPPKRGNAKGKSLRLPRSLWACRPPRSVPYFRYLYVQALLPGHGLSVGPTYAHSGQDTKRTRQGAGYNAAALEGAGRSLDPRQRRERFEVLTRSPSIPSEQGGKVQRSSPQGSGLKLCRALPLPLAPLRATVGRSPCFRLARACCWGFRARVSRWAWHPWAGISRSRLVAWPREAGQLTTLEGAIPARTTSPSHLLGLAGVPSSKAPGFPRGLASRRSGGGACPSGIARHHGRPFRVLQQAPHVAPFANVKR